MENKSEKQTSERSIQDYLSLGYIYLLILGIGREVIYYWSLDINILSYSNVLDVLLSPIIFLASKPEVVFGLIFLSIIIFYASKRKLKKSLLDDAITDSEKIKMKETNIINTLFLIALMVFGFFIGTGIGSGFKHGGKLAKGELKVSHQITFLEAATADVKLIGNNSGYIFYVLENEKHVTISPIQGNVKSMVKLPEESGE